jgi:uncharacterized membrane protein YeaQ/YmgE (transglycosylase-associated protein family)
MFEEETMSILSWIIVGLIAGRLAGLTMKGGGYGFIGNLVVGVLGALLGGFLATLLFGGDHVTDFNWGTILVALGGSIVLIWMVRLLPSRSPL